MTSRLRAAPQLSVVIATYNRGPLLQRLLQQLDVQTLPHEDFEVVIVDDGSAEPARTFIEPLKLRLQIELLEQKNGGAASARHNGVSHARGEVVVIIDDDMQIAPEFLAEHLRAHEDHPHTVVFGRIRADPALEEMPLFERYNASRLHTWVDGLRKGEVTLHGNHLCTGNVSFRRRDYEAAGGFDLELKRSEDAELGLRLEKLGVRFTFSEAAYVVHGSDHRSSDAWLQSAHRYGIYDLRIGRKHASLAHADPWRYFFSLRPVIRPFLAASVGAPKIAEKLTRATMKAAELIDRAGLEGPAIRATALVYGMEYFRGIRTEAGSLGGALRSVGEYLAKAAEAEPEAAPAPRWAAALSRAIADLGADRATRHHYENKYGYSGERGGSAAGELVNKIGLQLVAGYRVMRMFRQAERPLAAKVTSRLMRHLYGSDVHWDAEFAPGVMFVHGMGLAISHAAKVGPGCILSQNVTLGMGIDPVTRETGAPTLEANVHVGAGATLLGPITVGANSKIMAGVVLTRSVPPNSLVEAPEPTIRSRDAQGKKAAPAASAAQSARTKRRG